MRGGGLLFFIGLVLTLFVPGFFFQWIGRSLLLLLLFAKLYSVFTRKFISVKRDHSETLAYRSESLPISASAHNLLPLPVPAFLLADEPGALKSSDIDRNVFSLLPGRLAKLVFHVKGQTRGKYFVGPLTVFSSDPLGFFPWWRTWHDSCAVTILPEILPLQLLFNEGVPLGEIATSNPLYEDPGRLRSFREYNPGDDPRRIQWKISAKSGQLQVADYFSTLSVPALFLLNLNPNDYAGKRVSTFCERAIVAAASAVQHWSAGDDNFALVSNGYEPILRPPAGPRRTKKLPQETSSVFPPEIRKFAFGKGRPHAAVLLRHLAVLSRPDNGSPQDTSELFAAGAELQPGPGCVVVYIGPGLRPEAYEEARILFAGQRIEFWILDEQVVGDGRIRSRTAASTVGSRKTKFRTLREFGDEAFENVT